MKKMALIVTVSAVLAAGMQSASAGDREWATAGKILTGVVAGSIITHAVTQPAQPVYQYTRVTHYYPAPVVVAPAPVVVHRAPIAVYAPPVMVRPAPVISFNIGHGHYSHRPYARHHSRGRGHWVCR